jgi:hypothetical protein
VGRERGCDGEAGEGRGGPGDLEPGGECRKEKEVEGMVGGWLGKLLVGRGSLVVGRLLFGAMSLAGGRWSGVDGDGMDIVVMFALLRWRWW